ncbi:beta-1,4-xylosyltransferase IRX9-like [Mercurialis annua]|uniref:beta-1,4-xylosyltransferase IRX9-like n=1 Tax=Mercurialis annua TaxID=3986 RepID=UPI00215E21EA|nr:beta-1,4-xylosyltransferase IRX9-like [Mercurialis annua]
MGSAERSKKRVQLWKNAIVHFCLCFVMGFFTGFAPTSKSSPFSTYISLLNKSHSSPNPNYFAVTPQTNMNTSQTLISASQNPREEETKPNNLASRRQIIIITPISNKYPYEEVLLRRLGNTIKLVSTPLLWIVVEGQRENNKVSEILRKTGIMYRHLVSKQNLSDLEDELDDLRNVGLTHIEQHRLSGIVHFASLSNVYDLAFFDELREIEGIGTWAMASVTPNKKNVIIEGAVCDSSQIIRWHMKKMSNNNESDATIQISSFAFNSSILWDPEIWGRPSSIPLTTQNSIKFVKQVALEDEIKLKGTPPKKCSKIMLWHLQLKSDNSITIASNENRDEGDKSTK